IHILREPLVAVLDHRESARDGERDAGAAQDLPDTRQRLVHGADRHLAHPRGLEELAIATQCRGAHRLTSPLPPTSAHDPRPRPKSSIINIRCPSCGFENAPGIKFCGECGRRLTAAPAAPVEPRTYTPRHLAEKILTSRAALVGERKQVTVLFADVKGSMEL